MRHGEKEYYSPGGVTFDRNNFCGLFVDGKEVAKFTTNKSGRRELKYTRKDP
jgi:hypothetical protein